MALILWRFVTERILPQSKTDDLSVGKVASGRVMVCPSAFEKGFLARCQTPAPGQQDRLSI